MEVIFIKRKTVNFKFVSQIYLILIRYYFLLEVKLPHSCEDLFFNFSVSTDGKQLIYPDSSSKGVRVYCRNSLLTDGKKLK